MRKKLIEVALPLEAINIASAREKSIRHGHPSTLHLWWARRPLAAARAVIFAQMVDDPSSCPELFPTEKAQEKERQRLFRIIEELVKWENTTNETVLQAARDEIWESWRRACAENADHPRAKELFDRYKLPAFHDPFAGGGALPLEAQRLGLEAYASDLNPVAVLINKAMIEIPPMFAGKEPVNPEWRNLDEGQKMGREWKGAQGLAEDVRYYGKWMRDEAEKRIGHLYPKVEITPEMVAERPDLEKYLGKKLTVIAWLWARTVKSPNPAFSSVDVPLVSTFLLSTKKGKEAYVEPVIENGGYRFTVKMGIPSDPEVAKKGTKTGSSGSSFFCLVSGTPMPFEYIRSEAKVGMMGTKLMAIVAEGQRGRVYLNPTKDHEELALKAVPEWRPETSLPDRALGFRVQEYGMVKWCDLFTSRQLVALTTFSDLVGEAIERIRKDTTAAGLFDDEKPLREGGTGARGYGKAVGVYLGLGISKLTDYNSSLVQWSNSRDQAVHVFGRQALPMVWDFTEVFPFGEAAGDITVSLKGISKSIEAFCVGSAFGIAENLDAKTQTLSNGKCICTDPPYYDNIGYADLSDYFYVWLRRSLRSYFPELFSTVAVPKDEELVATPYRHGSKENAESFFLNGMTQAMQNLVVLAHAAFPVSIYYAFKQAESNDFDGTASTGWETFLDAVIRAGFTVTGTWPMRTERQGRMVSNNTNALASSIVLVCRKRPDDAPVATRREFVSALKNELPNALRLLQAGNIAPVDLQQAAIGPGMSVFTRFSQILDAQGKPMAVREALALINQILDEALAEQEGDFDSESRWALAWFDQSGFSEGEYGVAETLSTAKNTSVQGIADAGVLESKRGKVRLLRPQELSPAWNPSGTDVTAWAVVHHLIRVLESGGETFAADMVALLGSKAEAARELAYRLYTICERKKRSAEALSYNGLVQSWPEITRLARESSKPKSEQGDLFE